MRLLLPIGLSFSFLLQAPAFAFKACEQQQCITIIDAGSTGSRLHIYSYDLDNTKTPINITERWSKKIQPGFATLTANQETINNYLNALFVDTPDYQTPIYLYATAGMRLLSKTQQQQLYSYAQNWFANQQQWQLVEAKTIPGSDEGLYGWLAVNYVLKRFNVNQKPVGVLDMGGASVQISFPVDDDNFSDNQNLRDITLYGQHYKLFTHSFLGLGQTEVSHQFLDNSACFANNYDMSSGDNGQGNAYQCENAVSLLLNNVHQVNKIVQPLIKANSINEWYTLGGISYLAQSKPFNFPDYQFTSQQLLEQANTELCQQDWSTLNSLYQDDPNLYGLCLYSAYYYALVIDGYGLQPDQPLNYLNSNQASDWTIGVVLNQAQALANKTN